MSLATEDPVYGARILERAGQLAQAASAYGEALCRDPGCVEALSGYTRIIEALPDTPDAYNDLGTALDQWGRPDLALACFERAVSLRPDLAQAHNNLGLCLRSQGRVAEAIAAYRRAVAIRPDYANAHWNLALALLLTGQFNEGWRRFAWRRRADLHAILPSHRKDTPHAWDGGPFRGRRLLVRHEQGMGDCIHMARYLPWVKALGGQVLLEATEPLASLLSTLSGVDQLAPASPDGEPRVDFDLHVHLMDLPGLLGTTLDTIPAQVPYVHADPDRVRQWRAALAGCGPAVGLVWAGHPRFPYNHIRSYDPSHLDALLDVPGIRWFSLQKGPAEALLTDVQQRRIHCLGLSLRDLSDTAAVLDNLDLLISMDTCVLHLAGALARPAWAVLAHVPDWRWLLDRSDSPWYPSLRLFRQSAPGQWGPVFREIRSALETWTATQEAGS